MGNTLVTLKGFGDFIIAINALRKVKTLVGRSNIELIAGRHVTNFAVDLGVEERVIFVGAPGLNDVPAIYNIKEQGLLCALKSLQQLHSEISKISNSSKLIFDKLGFRERMIGAGHKLIQLPESSNIYFAYDKLFKGMGYDNLIEIPSQPKGNTAIIVPGARSIERVISSSLIKKIYEKLLSFNFNPKVVLLEGEAYKTPEHVNVEIIPRKFSSLIDSIKSADLVISADSLPAHLSEFFLKPVFVFTPVPKWSIYWLPKSAFNSNGMSSFEDINNLHEWLALNYSFLRK
ncbi:hypothetical protein [Polynucleobacter yangtzensis]|uniref:hypothetical protein n=1 Tax=Polynucleobacter yangtzensis TaxID=1743159 RepID=UPI00082EAAFE|nr:hypothetical protein [Polynucleobacter yangtzensis]